MSDAPEHKELPLADRLALERTALANDRTLLAYVRTALGLLAAGVTVLKLFASNGMQMVGYILIASGVCALVIGLMNYHEVRNRLTDISHE